MWPMHLPSDSDLTSFSLSASVHTRQSLAILSPLPDTRPEWDRTRFPRHWDSKIDDGIYAAGNLLALGVSSWLAYESYLSRMKTSSNLVGKLHQRSIACCKHMAFRSHLNDELSSGLLLDGTTQFSDRLTKEQSLS